MARARRTGAGTRFLIDDQGMVGPITHLGQAHNLAPDDVTAARNTTAFSSHCGLVYIWAEVRCRWVLGDNAVVADGTDKVLPPNVYLPVPLWADLDGNADYISIIRADGNVGAVEAQIIETVD